MLRRYAEKHFFAAILWRRISGKWLKIDTAPWWFSPFATSRLMLAYHEIYLRYPRLRHPSLFSRKKYAFYRLIASAEIAKHDCIITRITSHVLLSAAHARIKNLSRVRQVHAPHTARTVLRLRSSTCAYIAVWNASPVT